MLIVSNNRLRDGIDEGISQLGGLKRRKRQEKKNTVCLRWISKGVVVLYYNYSVWTIYYLDLDESAGSRAQV